MPPFRQRSAAAASTPSGAPPMPMTACTLVPRTAAEMPAERSPSLISLMRAPALRMSSMSFSWRGAIEDDDDEVARPTRPRRVAIAFRFVLDRRVECRSRPCAAGPTMIFSM